MWIKPDPRRTEWQQALIVVRRPVVDWTSWVIPSGDSGVRDVPGGDDLAHVGSQRQSLQPSLGVLHVASPHLQGPFRSLMPVLKEEPALRIRRGFRTVHYYVYLDVQRQWRWTLYAANNRKIANSGEGYNNKQDCVADINLVASTGHGNGTPIKYAA